MATDRLERRYRERSLWLDSLSEPLTPRPSLPGDVDCDVCIVGAGYTGLWTALYLKRLQPDLRVVVVDREIAGFGPAGRNGGFASAFIAGQAGLYARRHGRDAVTRAQRATFAAVGEIGRVAADERIDCAFVHAGSLRVAFSAPQLARVEATVHGHRAYGIGDDDIRLLSAGEVAERIGLRGVVGGSYTPHTARIQPAALARGLAAAAERRGAVIHERTEALRLEPGRVVTRLGTIRAGTVVRATEAYTIEQPGARRRYLPLYSLMIATEPLPAESWAQLGWGGREPVADQHYLFFYAQRTADDRIAIGGRGAPYRLGSPVGEEYERRPEVRDRLAAALRRHFPGAGTARITHHWGGPLAMPRDHCMSIGHDPRRGVAWAGGYSGHGVVAANISGRTLADLILRRDSDLVTLPWVGWRSPRWEPEPLRFAASRTVVRIMRSTDRVEDATDRPARRVALVRRFLPGR
jgi:glycine/D-amino acid oxidase-like deaminating enzyme